MTVARDFLDILQRCHERRPLPAVRALHLPPPGAQDKSAEFCAVELEDGALGLSYVLLGDTLAELHAGTPQLAGRPALEVAGWYADGVGIQRTLGFAAVNAMTRSLFDRAGFVPPASADSIGQLDPRPGDRVGMIGLFGPLVERIVAAGADLTVVELRAELAGEREGWRVTMDPAALAGCNKVLATSTVLLNDTLEGILGHCRAAHTLAMIGPGAACLPDPLFERGVTLLGGSWIGDRSGFLQALTQGESWSRHARKVALTPAVYPGWEALVDRLP
jgi:uncharacterized protein (DUF4213/DUF364 family)